MAKTWTLGTRGSLLARTQSQHVADAIEALTGDTVVLEVISTRGDRIRDRPLAEIGGKGLFTAELEEGMVAGRIDLAVHSLKDMPTEIRPELVIGPPPPRADARDVLVGGTLDGLAKGATVGTGSLRRRMQLAAVRPDLVFIGMRGNIGTRIQKQRDGACDAIVLAGAGLQRADRVDDIDEVLDVSVCVPAPGQGALAVQCRADDAAMLEVLTALGDRDTRDSVALERAFMAGLGGGCSVPAGCHAAPDGDTLHVHAFLGRSDGAWVAEVVTVRRDAAATAGSTLAAHLRRRLQDQPVRHPDEGVAPRG